MKKLLFSLALMLVGSACVVDTEGIEGIEDAEEIEGVGQEMVDAGYWYCSQPCANGSVSTGYGSTASGAYQDLAGCGPGGGAISCRYIDNTPILTE